MGNCLFLQARAIQIMRTNGEIIEYKAPIKVYQILSKYVGHAISENTSVYDHLSPDDELLEGHLYYLVPNAPVPKVDTKRIELGNQATEGGQGAGVVRIKLMICKKELQAMLKEGLTIKDVVSYELQNVSHQLQNRHSLKLPDGDSGDDVVCQGWKPVLESIPEVN